MNLPECPNVKEKHCQRSELRVAGENEQAWFFFCKTCHLCWTVSKPRTSEKAKWETQMERVKKLTDHEREQASKTKYFLMPGVS